MKTLTQYRFLYSLTVASLLWACQSSTKTPVSESKEQPVTEQPEQVQAVPSATNEPAATGSSEKDQGLGGDDVSLLGWSKNGRTLAYRTFFLSYSISTHSSIGLIVTDIVSDKVLWSYRTSWDEGNVGGDDDTPSAPKEGNTAWELVPAEERANLTQFGIDYSNDPAQHKGYSSFPLQLNGDEFTALLSEQDSSYVITVLSQRQGEKRVYTQKKDPSLQSELSVAGYFINPQQDRIAVVVVENNLVINHTDYSVIGCHLRSGFVFGK